MSFRDTHRVGRCFGADTGLIAHMRKFVGRKTEFYFRLDAHGHGKNPAMTDFLESGRFVRYRDLFGVG